MLYLAPLSLGVPVIRTAGDTLKPEDAMHGRRTGPTVRADPEGVADAAEYFFCVMARSNVEPERVYEFVDHYESEGADRIFIMEDSTADHVNVSAFPRVESRRVRLTNDQGGDLTRFVQPLKDKCTWIASVDIDEFLTTKKHAARTVREELQQSFDDVDLIHVPWVYMSFDPNVDHAKSLREECVYRWDYNKKHSTEFRHCADISYALNSKGVIRSRRFSHFDDPHRVVMVNESIIVQGHPNRTAPTSDSNIVLRFHEKDLSETLLALYHYRFGDMNDLLRRAEKCDRQEVGNFARCHGNSSATTESYLQFCNYREVHDDTLKNKVASRKSSLRAKT